MININEHWNEVVYVYNLNYQAPFLLKYAKDNDFKIVAGKGRRPSKWCNAFMVGDECPKTYSVTFCENNKRCVIYDYSRFVKIENEEPNAEVTKLLHQYGSPMTGRQIIKNLINKVSNYVAEIPDTFSQIELDNYDSLFYAFHGGAAYNFKKFANYETHIDFHQSYANAIINNKFPIGSPTLVDGFVKKDFAIYKINGGYARLKENGFPLLSNRNFAEDMSPTSLKMFGSDHEWFSLTDLHSICSVDLELLEANYDITDLSIESTMYWTQVFDGKLLKPVVDEIYNGRKTACNEHVKSFYKMLNEIIAGYFEMTVKTDKQWLSLEKQRNGGYIRNPKVGIFITAFARKNLYEQLLLKTNFEDIIGYDTDCVFVNQPKDKIALENYNFGNEIGQVHFDGIYMSVHHDAIKYYYGYDLEKDCKFEKLAGVSKSGKIMVWNWKEQIYEIKEDKR